MQPLVSVKVITYNHVDYIGKCLDSILMQKTNFPFEIVIGEDCSTDGTREIVFDYAKKHPNKTRVITSKENVGMMKNSYRTLLAAKGKYLAFCEGDDYWIDPLKLQKQVDFLEANPEYGMVHTDLHEYNTVTKKWRKNIWKGKNLFQRGDIFNCLLIGGLTGIYTCTALVRSDMLLENIDDYFRMNLAMGDSFMWLTMASKGKVGYIDHATAVRQLLEISATQGINFDKKKHFIDSANTLIDYFSQKIQIDPNILTLAEKSNALKYLEFYRLYDKKHEFDELYSAFRKKYFEPEAILLKISGLGKYPYYFSRVISKMLIMMNLDFKSKVYRKLRKQISHK